MPQRISRKSSTAKKYEWGYPPKKLWFVSQFTKLISQSFFWTVFTNEISILVIKFVLDKINLTWHSTKLIIMLFFVWINMAGCFHCNTDTPCTLFRNAISPKLVVRTYGWRHSSVQCKKHPRSSPRTFLS